MGESVAQPLRYYHNKVAGTLALCEVLAAHGVRNLVFRPSATVYDAASPVPNVEDLPLQPANPYGRTKAMIEDILATSTPPTRAATASRAIARAARPTRTAARRSGYGASGVAAG